jgi:ADP-heptose:LPS heptosyltransferase
MFKSIKSGRYTNQAMKKICIVRKTSGIGDILMISPIIKELSLKNKSKIDFYTNLDFISEVKVLRKNPYVKAVYHYEQLNHKLYDEIYDLSYVAYAYESSGFLFSRQEIFSKYCNVVLKDFTPIYSNNVSYSYKKLTVGIHTEGAEGRRSWSQLKTELFIKWLLKNTDVDILYLNQKPLNITDNRIKDCSNYELDKCVQLLSGVKFLLCVDSCFMHFASIYNIKSLVLFGSTKPQTRIKHYKNHSAFYTKSQCRGCFYKTCEVHNCMESISLEDVIEKVKEYAFLF